MKYILLTLLILTSQTAFAEAGKVPYFVSIKSDDANVRTGPSVRYPIKWTYKRAGWPLEVTAIFEQWRKIKDIDGQEGWMHESLLSNNRRVIINNDTIVKFYRLPIESAVPVLLAEKGVVAKLETCKSNWCKVKKSGQSGWVQNKYLWGVYEDELFD